MFLRVAGMNFEEVVVEHASGAGVNVVKLIRVVENQRADLEDGNQLAIGGVDVDLMLGGRLAKAGHDPDGIDMIVARTITPCFAAWSRSSRR